MWSLFKSASYFRLWLAQVISELGDGLTRTLIIFLVATETHNPLMIGMVVFAQLLPTAIFGIILGPLADKLSKRNILVSMDLYRMTVVILMITFQDLPWILLLLIVLQGIGTALFEPTRSASIALLVKEDKLAEAVGLSQGTRQAMMIIGPSIAGVILFLKDYTTMLVVDGITFVLSAILLMTISVLATPLREAVASGENYFVSIGRGVKEVTRIPSLRFLLVLLIPVSLGAGVLSTNISAMFLETFKVQASQFGFLQAGVGAGAVIGSLTAPAILKKLRPSTMLFLSTGILGLWMIVVFALPDLLSLSGLVIVYIWAMIVGYLNALLNVPLGSLFLGITPTEFLGRGASLMQATVNLWMIIGILFGGYLAGLSGSVVTTGITGIFITVVISIFPFFKGFKTLSNVGKKVSTGEVAS